MKKVFYHQQQQKHFFNSVSPSSSFGNYFTSLITSKNNHHRNKSGEYLQSTTLGGRFNFWSSINNNQQERTFRMTACNSVKESLLQSLFVKRVKTSVISTLNQLDFHSNNSQQCVPVEYKQVPAQIVKIIQESSKTKRFLLNVENLKTSHAFFVFFAGQYVNIHIGDLTTSISISSPPILNSNLIEITVQLSNHPITSALHQLKVGDYIKVTGPLGKFYFNLIDNQYSELNNLVLIAGGLGVTPLISILKYITQNGLCFVKVKLLYSASSVEDFCFVEDILDILRENSNVECVLLTSQINENIPKPLESILKYERIDVNYLRKELSNEELKNACYYLCGPLSMVKDISASLQELSVPFDRIKLQ